MFNILESHIILYILEFLSDSDKIRFMSTCKSIYTFRSHVTYNNFYVYDTVNHLSFVDKFKKLIHLKFFDENQINYGPIFIVKSIRDIIPPYIKCIVFDDSFDEDITDFIPEGIVCIIFGTHFNKPIQKILPSSITHIIFGYMFNQSIKDILPHGLIELTLGYNFNQSINDIPNTITKLMFDSEFIPEIHGKIPNSINCLGFDGYHGQIQKKDIPNNINHLIIGTGYHSNMCLVIEDCISKIITENITHLTLGWNFDGMIFNIPNGVTHLFLHQKFNPVIIKYLPSSIKYVEFIEK
ncbi:putative F-box and FNIP repeat-containing protein [Hirudovirus strain Sangsue]|nr:putative F-box and FNIP repeat-containing protein [Hirudovirus strain Sangsue]